MDVLNGVKELFLFAAIAGVRDILGGIKWAESEFGNPDIAAAAEKLGYGANSQYFSQVFKKYTGLSPLEYKESVRLTSKQ